MSIAENIVVQAHQRGIRFLLEDDKLRLKVPQEERIDQELLDQIRQNKEVIKSFLKNTTVIDEQPAHQRVVPVSRTTDEHIPLSFSQERLWFIDSLQGSVQYHMPWVFTVNGALDVMALEASFRSIIDRHEILRSVIEEKDGLNYQRIIAADEWKMECRNVEELEGKTAQAYLNEQMLRAYDLREDLMLRVCLVSESADSHLLLIMLHHIAFDGLSIPIMINELQELYSSKIENRQAKLAPLSIQYADYAIWQREYLSGELLETKLNYWKEKLAGVEPLALSADHVRPSVQSVRGGIVKRNIDKEIHEGLVSLSNSEGLTLFMTMLAAFKALLYRYTGQQDICIGSPVAGRQQQEVEGLIGFFVNMISLRTQLSGEASMKDLLQSVRATTLGAYSHQEVPFEKVVEALGVERDMSRTPVFQVSFALQNVADIDEMQLGTAKLMKKETGEALSKFDLHLDVLESASGLQLELTYCSDLYRADMMQGLLDHYEHILKAVIKNIDRPVAELPILSLKEEKQLLEEFNDTARDYPTNKTILDLFAQQVSNRANETALVFEEEALSYKQLDERSNQLAHYLQSKGVTTETLVPVCIDRSPEMIIALFAILKAGGAYVPIDSALPPERIGYMLKDTAAEIIVTTSNHEGLISTESPAAELVCLDTLSDLLPQLSAEKIESAVTPNNLAYVIYTSGSTGLPKGVMIEHAGVVNLVHNQAGPLNLRPGIRVFQFASFSFDASCYEMFLTLLHGGQLVMSPKETLLDTKALSEVLNKHEVELITLPTSYQSVISEEITAVKTVVSAGEALNPKLAAEIQQKGIKLINAYGPTENTVCAALSESPLHETGCVTIGKPLGNVQAYILDGRLQPVPVGVMGELYLGGAQIARGYLNREELTAERFVVRPSTTHPSTALRMYKTGDCARWLPDGNIEYLGRTDDQVKIRGYRIELGEIETVLQQAPGVSHGVVIAKEDKHKAKQLIAYILPQSILDKEAVTAFLKTKLPDYMIPSILVELNELPLTSSGKVDKKCLPQVDAASNQYIAPRTELETQLAGIWQELLSADRIGMLDNFFSLGGHSLLAMRMVSAIRKKIGKEVAIKEIFNYPTVAALAAQIGDTDHSSLLPAIKAYDRTAHLPLSFSQERLWFIDRLQGSVQYHMPWVFAVNGELD
ncbi:MAG: amino acid adenylation domain-containing protein, partial [Chitinophagaceae bacterium]